MERLHQWKMALNQAANLSGHYFNPRNGYEYEFIQEIVKYVSNKINRDPLDVIDYPVGLLHRVLKVNSLLEVGSNDEVMMLGIYGPGGMGCGSMKIYFKFLKKIQEQDKLKLYI
ncbi:hypothetical protein P8452_55840 [Trifolium repens]|nr:hypothetical protein P8452_55840 [Trifolium repens]